MERTAILCDLLGVRYPLMQGGMAHISDARLAAAVSNGGGLGIISAASGNPDVGCTSLRPVVPADHT